MPRQTPDSIIDAIQSRVEKNALRSMQVRSGVVDFSSNDYLGFAGSKEIYESAHRKLEAKGLVQNGSTGSRLLSGNSDFYVEVEQQLADFHGEESALLFNSGYAANVGLIGSVPQRHDCILYDEYIHASIREGILGSNATAYKFRHNDFDHLEKRLRSLAPKTRNFYVITESVFSMDGDSPDLEALVKVCSADNVFVIIDEAHATGVIGAQGQGLVQSLGIGDAVFARIHTFGKGMGCHGAVVLGNRSLQNYLINFSRSFIYTTALPPHAVATIASSYEELQNTDQIALLASRVQHFKAEIEKLGLQSQFIDSESSIHCCVIRGNEQVRKISSSLLEAGFDVRPILSPTVPAGKERLRFCLHSYNTEEEIARVLIRLADLIGK